MKQHGLTSRDVAQLIENQQVKFRELAFHSHQWTLVPGFHQLPDLFCHFQQQTVPFVRLMNSLPSAAIKPSKTGGDFSAWHVSSDPS